MHKCLNYALLLLAALFVSCSLLAQFPSNDSAQNIELPRHIFESVELKVDKFHSLLANTSRKYINKLIKRENSLKRKLARIDTSAALGIFGDVDTRYKNILSTLSD